MNGFTSVVELLLKLTRANPATSIAGWKFTPFNVAAARGHINVVRVLLGVDNVFKLDAYKAQEALEYAVHGGHVQVFKMILQHDKIGTKCYCEGLIGKAIDNDDVEMLKAIFEDGRASINANIGACDTPLTYASMKGKAKVVRYLCNDSRTEINKRDHRGLNALGMATRRQYAEVVKILLEHQCDDKIYDDDEIACSALHSAVGCKPEILEAFLNVDYIDVNVRDRQGLSPLHDAAKYGALESAKLLCKHSKIDVNAVDNKFRTPLHYAVRKRQLALVEFLCGLDAARAQTPHAKSGEQSHESDLALRRGQFKKGKKRQRHGSLTADTNAQDFKGNTVLHYVARLKSRKAAKIAQILGAHPCADLKVLNNEKKTALQVAIKANASAVVRKVLQG